MLFRLLTVLLFCGIVVNGFEVLNQWNTLEYDVPEFDYETARTIR